LAATVVSSGGALAEALAAEGCYGLAQLVERADGAVVAEGKVVAAQPVLLLDAILNGGQH
jgi:hypothetical protein